MMNVCILTPRYYPNTPGGGALSCHLIARELQKHVNVDVISLDGDKTKTAEIDKVRVLRLKPSSSEKTLLNLQAYNFLKKKLSKYDLIHTYNMDLMPSLGLLTRRYKIQSLATLNGTIYTRMNEWFYTFQKNMFDIRNTVLSVSLLTRNVVHKTLIKRIKMFTALCQYRKEIFVNEGIPQEKITVIPNILDTTRPLPPSSHKDGKVNILYFGTSRWRKGLDVLIQAYSLLKKQNIELKIAGLNDTKKIESIVEKRRIQNDVEICGHIPYDEIGGVYARSDILVFPLRFPEPVGRVLIEGMQQGLCLIATGTDKYSPIIRDEKDGILFYPCTPKNLAKKIQYVIDNDKLLTILKRNARERVYDICHPDKVGRKYIELYEKMLR